MATTSTHLRQHVNAPRPAVYRALLNAGAVAAWMVPVTLVPNERVVEVMEIETADPALLRNTI